MRCFLKGLLVFLATFAALVLVHLPVLGLPYFWDETGYYIPAARDFYRFWLLIPTSTQPEGHTPLVMIYLGLAWRLCGYSAWVTRAAMTLIATATVVSLYRLGRHLASREIAAWSALLLALSPLFFAQTTLAHLDLAAALFTTLAVRFLLAKQPWLFALAASLAILSKETAMVLLPVVWLCTWRRERGLSEGHRARVLVWAPLVAPLVPLAVWAIYYHHATGYWTGNREYLSYNLYSTLSPARFFWSLVRRAYELLVGGFHWLLIAGATAGWWWGRKHGTRDTGYGVRDTGNDMLGTDYATRQAGDAIPEMELVQRDSGRTTWGGRDAPNPSLASRIPCPAPRTLWRRFALLTSGLFAVYLLLLSVVGGAILPRYLLPVLPLFYLVAVALVTRLPRFPARLILATAAACFLWAWFINPPYPFPFEDNLAYVDFIRLHEQAAHFLEARAGQARILTAWPATGELTSPFLGYTSRPLRVVPLPSFTRQAFAGVQPESFDLLYLYSRQWDPPGNWLEHSLHWLQMQRRYFKYQPQIADEALVARYHLRLVAEMKRRGQWVRIYAQTSQ